MAQNTDGSISQRLAGLSKEELLANFGTQLKKAREREAALQAQIKARDEQIAQINTELSQINAQRKAEQELAGNLITSANEKATKTRAKAQSDATAILKRANDTLTQAQAQGDAMIKQANAKAAKIINDADKQANTLVAAKMQQANEELAKIDRQRQDTISSLITIYNNIISECDGITTETQSTLRSVSVLRQNTAKSLEMFSSERYVRTSMSNAVAQSEASVDDASDDDIIRIPAPQTQASDDDLQSLDDDGLLAFNAMFGNGEQTDITANESSAEGSDAIASPHPRRRPVMTNSDGSVMRNDDIASSDASVFDEESDDNDLSDEFVFNPDNATSFTGEFMRLDDNDARPLEEDDDFDMVTDGNVAAMPVVQPASDTTMTYGTDASQGTTDGTGQVVMQQTSKGNRRKQQQGRWY